MPYFSRLTDIVTCNLSTILEQASDPQATLAEIIREMEEGNLGAQRSVKTAEANVQKITEEIETQRHESERAVTEAKDALQSNREADAREALARKHEIESLIAGLDQQLQAATATRDHLKTLANALRARLADAKRRLQAFEEHVPSVEAAPASEPAAEETPDPEVSAIDAELEELKRQLRGDNS